MDLDFLLIRKMKQGDDEAFELFIHKYYRDILSYCKYHCADSMCQVFVGTFPYLLMSVY